MRLLPLNPRPENMGGNPWIQCLLCGPYARRPYNKAAEQGWRYDADGEPFTAYYCPHCVKHVPELQP
jgi:hypothetical protein